MISCFQVYLVCCPHMYYVRNFFQEMYQCFGILFQSKIIRSYYQLWSSSLLKHHFENIFFHATRQVKDLLPEHKINDFIDPQFLDLKGTLKACRAPVFRQRRWYQIHINDNTTEEACMQVAFTGSPVHSLTLTCLYEYDIHVRKLLILVEINRNVYFQHEKGHLDLQN